MYFYLKHTPNVLHARYNHTGIVRFLLIQGSHSLPHGRNLNDSRPHRDVTCEIRMRMNNV